MFYHGSHPEHPLRTLKNPKAGVLCSICKACAHPSMAEWCFCMQAGCGYILCCKCSEIEEQLFDIPQVITRNPVLPHEDMSVCLRTRPRSNAHVLCPLYPRSSDDCRFQRQRHPRCKRSLLSIKEGWMGQRRSCCACPSIAAADRGACQKPICGLRSIIPMNLWPWRKFFFALMRVFG
ncbi:hypothetical protein C3747_216g3 [Trypanosoma cruzi]|uniref:Uncharacterized protein n=1 Tax=Trypanosoma cruzi TaxID=5693 RepID=A0A2V2VUY9_TRYCR|nr:hypothetical protein C3747_216g3 [Trypanosoma cruzi]